MLSEAEQRLYYWLAREGVGGTGTVVDLGCFAGGSTARLAQGLSDGGRTAQIHLYDRFTASEGIKQRMLYPAGIARFADNDILPLAHDLLAPWAERLHWHPGDITYQHYPDDADDISLLILDLCKLPAPSDHVARSFLPRLTKGALVNQQDMLQWDQPWTPVQMLLLSDWLEPVARVATSMLFRCVRVPDAREVDAASIADLDDATLITALAEAKDRFGHLGQPEVYDIMAATVRANPGVRVPWGLTRTIPPTD